MKLPSFDIFRPREPHADAMGVFVPAMVLTGLGLVCVYSFGDEHIMRQAVWALLGIAACIAVSRIPLQTLRRAAVPTLCVCAVLLLVALLFAPRIAGTHRWLVIPSVGYIQPSELAKLAVVLYLAHRLAQKRKEAPRALEVAWPVLGLGLLILFAPDLGTCVFIGAVVAAMLLIGGVRIGRVLAGVTGALPLLLLVLSHYPYMRRRLDFFRGEMNYQQDQALVALGNGGLLGQGLGAGRQKMQYLPEGHSDFVFPNVGEELGFLGVALIGVLFALICINGVRVALAAARKNRFGFHLVCGAIFVVVFQAVVNIAVATGAAPTKGISLPFLSHGGSNLIVSLVAIGLVVNVGRSLEEARP